MELASNEMPAIYLEHNSFMIDELNILIVYLYYTINKDPKHEKNIKVHQ